MEIFVSTVAAVIVGNLLCLIFVYGVWRATKEERSGAKHGLDRVPVALRVLMLLAPATIAAGAFLLH